MLSRISLFILVLAFHFTSAQTQFGKIRVTVLDATSNEPLPFANVYLSQTTIGGYTNEKGEVELTKIPFGAHRLIVSEISHDTYQRGLTVESEQLAPLSIKLVVKVLEEVQVTAKKDKQWNRQLERFEKLFFGAEHYKQCKITNPWVLNFKIVNGNVVAEASEPLKIENDYLGYNLDFSLKNCFFGATSFAISGLTRFEEKKGDDATVNKWKANRENTYRGSPQHFFRSAINNTAISEGYLVYRDITTKEKINRTSTLSSNIHITIEPDSLNTRVKKSDHGLYSITLPARLEVHYLRKRAAVTAYTDTGNPITWIEVKKGPLIVNKEGIVQNTDNLSLSGWMSDLRVGDWLPLNYQPSEINNSRIVSPIIVKKDFREKPYVQTDRNYYYSGETIWLKGYMKYASPILKDTLSKTIYVELIDRDGNIIVKKRYPIEGGSFYGDMFLEGHFRPGACQLKAYTSSILSSSPQLIFTRTVYLLADNEIVPSVLKYQSPKDTLSSISLRTDKKSYSPKEKITLTIDVMDSLDFGTSADLSISVTDFDQNVQLKQEKTIINNFSLDKSSAITVAKNIEHGVPFNGTYTISKKPVKAKLTFVQHNSTETFDVNTDDTGRFRKFLSFYDTLDFYVKTEGNKKGVVVMDTTVIMSPILAGEPLDLEVRTSKSIRQVSPIADSTKILKTVSVKGKKIDKPTHSTLYSSADYVVEGAWIQERNYNDIFQAITARVPGLQYTPGNVSIRFIASEFGSFNNGAGGGSPLIMVDNVPMTESQVLSVPIRSIDRVDVLKYGSASIYGSRGGNGVIAIFTKSGIPTNIANDSFDKNKLQDIKWMGYNSSLVFKPIKNSATIYWSPSAPATLSFEAGEMPATYRIVVEGVTAAGVPVRAEKIVEIVKSH